MVVWLLFQEGCFDVSLLCLATQSMMAFLFKYSVCCCTPVCAFLLPSAEGYFKTESTSWWKNYLPPYHSISLYRRKKFRRLGYSVGEHWKSPVWGEEGSSVTALLGRGLKCAGVSRVTAGKAERNCSWAKSLHRLKDCRNREPSK